MWLYTSGTDTHSFQNNMALTCLNYVFERLSSSSGRPQTGLPAIPSLHSFNQEDLSKYSSFINLRAYWVHILNSLLSRERGSRERIKYYPLSFLDPAQSILSPCFANPHSFLACLDTWADCLGPSSLSGSEGSGAISSWSGLINRRGTHFLPSCE